MSEHTPAPCQSVTVRLPLVFFEDHGRRDLPTPQIVHQTTRHVWVAVDDLAIPELLSDAKYYASEARYMGPEYFGLGASARATVQALEGATR